MISPKDFATRWGQDAVPLMRFAKATVESLRISDDDKAFLLTSGLPADAAPFLGFQAPSSGALPTVAEQWGVAKEFERYRVIGGDGSGSPIALDEEANGEVVCLDHDDRFARMLMNQTVRQLAESLLAYRKLVEATTKEFGEDAFLDGRTSPAARAELKKVLTRIDPDAVKAGQFWHRELTNLDANAG